jgi:hypothetical protein
MDETPFTWTGSDGLVYELTTVEDRHLRFFHRRLRERINQYETALAGNSLTPVGITFFTKLQQDEKRVWQEIVKRGLIPLAVRTEQEIATARSRAQERQAQQQAYQEAVARAQQILQARADAQAFGPGSQGVGGPLLGPGVQGTSVGSPYNPRNKQFSRGTVTPVEDHTPTIETETPRHIRLPKKK